MPPCTESIPPDTVMLVVPPPCDVHELVLHDELSEVPPNCSSKFEASCSAPPPSSVTDNPLAVPPAKSDVLLWFQVPLVANVQVTVDMVLPAASLAPDTVAA